MNIKWEEGAPAPVKCTDHTAVWLNRLVYVGGGYEAGVGAYTINCYDPVRNSWSSPINTPYCLFAMTKLNNKLLIAGGRDKSYKVTNQLLTMDDGQLKNYTKMTIARSTAAAAGHQGMLIITGGYDDDKGKRLSSTELFDSTNGQWYTCSNLPQPLSWPQSVIIDNILYLLGGVNKDYSDSPAVFTASLDNLSRHQMKWNTHQHTPWYCSAPVSFDGTQLLMLGGKKGFTSTSDVHKLNMVSQSWEVIGNIPSARHSSAAVSTADRVIVIGGYNDKRNHTNTVWIGSCEPQ